MTKDSDVKSALTKEETVSDGYITRGKIYKRMTQESTFCDVSGITKANPGVVTTTNDHGYTTGERVTFSGMNEMTELENATRTIIVTGVNTFTIGTTAAYGAAEVTGCKCFQAGLRVLAVSGITKANPGVVTTATNHGLATGDTVRFYGLQEMTELNTMKEYPIIVTAGTTFSIIDTSDYTAETSGGYCVWEYEPRIPISTITSANPGVVTTTMQHNIASTDKVYFEAIESGYVVITGITSDGGGTPKCTVAYNASNQFTPVIGDEIVISGSDVAGYNTTHEITGTGAGTFDTDIGYTADGAACTGESLADTMELLNDSTTGVTATYIDATSFSIGDQSLKMKGMNGRVYKWPGHIRAPRREAYDHLSTLSEIDTRYTKSGLSDMGRLGHKTV
jgi:hypothetical protein